MKSWGNRTGFHGSIIKSFSRGQNDPPPPPPVLSDNLVQWLGQLTLLYGVPIEYLVPDARMLPNECIRFFYLDRNWLDRLVDGALSVGVLSTKEMLFNAAFFESIYQQIDEQQLRVRSTVRNDEIPQVNAASGTMTGLLFRSQVVTDYPGVELKPYDENGTLLNILRMDRLSSSLIICIFDGVPVKVDFVQPGEGLHFGIFTSTDDQPANTDDTSFNIYIRGLGYPSGNPSPYPAGVQIENPPNSGQYVKATGKLLTGQSAGVVDVKATVSAIESVMNGLNPGALENGKLTPGGFAIQMTRSGEIQTYALLDKNQQPPPACEYTPS